MSKVSHRGLLITFATEELDVPVCEHFKASKDPGCVGIYKRS